MQPTDGANKVAKQRTKVPRDQFLTVRDLIGQIARQLDQIGDELGKDDHYNRAMNTTSDLMDRVDEWRKNRQPTPPF